MTEPAYTPEQLHALVRQLLRDNAELKKANAELKSRLARHPETDDKKE